MVRRRSIEVNCYLIITTCLEYTPYRRQERDQGHIMSSLMDSNLGNVLEKIPFEGLEDGISRMGTGT